MATLTSSGIDFSNGAGTNVLNSKYGIIPQSSAALFYESAAPTGWTKLTTQDNKACRVVSGTGGGSGGSIAFTTAFPSAGTSFSAPVSVSGNIGSTTIDVNTMATHSHSAVTTGSGGDHTHGHNGAGSFPGNRTPANNPGPVRPSGSSGFTSGPANPHTHPFNQGGSGNSGSHTHPFSASAANFSGNVDLRVQYVDIIVCTLN